MNLQNRKGLIDLRNKHGCLPKMGREGQGVWDGHVHTAVLKMDNQQGHTAQHMELCSMICSSLDGKGVWGRMETGIHIAESSHCLLETITTLLTGYTPIQSKKFSFFLKNTYHSKPLGISKDKETGGSSLPLRVQFLPLSIRHMTGALSTAPPDMEWCSHQLILPGIHPRCLPLLAAMCTGCSFA